MIYLEKTRKFDPSIRPVLLIFKHRSIWNEDVVRIFSYLADVHYIFHAEYFKTDRWLRGLNKYAAQQGIKVVIVDPEFYPKFGLRFFKKLSTKYKVGMMLFDDATFHRENMALAKYVNFVLTACPLSVLKYQEYGVPVHLFMCSDPDKFSLQVTNLKSEAKNYLFYGSLTEERKKFLVKLENSGVSVKQLAGNTSYDDLKMEIFNAKAVLNFSMGIAKLKGNYFPRESYFTLKLRPFEVGWASGLCLTESSPQAGLIFPGDVLPSFENYNQLLDLIKSLENSEYYDLIRRRFIEFVNINYSRSRIVSQLEKFLLPFLEA